ncbi:uncharacterized protein LOC131166557 [Malania oleifera]|uniref:uncharacterized protein LOC131166557 n=1 Tax=Malania oleifera TaxID=397392 RepID=UPI0025AE5469|nr:uncharacterized protein LOC131166557 [Malania oleifera]
MRPFPTIEQAYAHVLREAVRQAVMITGGSTKTQGAVLASKSFKTRHSTSNSTQFLSLGNGKTGTSSKKKVSPSNGTKCSHCGNLKYSQENCFKLHGYSDCWNELQAKKGREVTDGGTDQVALAAAKLRLSLSEPGFSYQGDHWAWY